MQGSTFEAMMKLDTITYLPDDILVKVDRAAMALDALGITQYLVEVGGELRARGKRPDGQPWRVAVETAASRRRATTGAMPAAARPATPTPSTRAPASPCATTWPRFP
ncbi:hypothetical protein G6F64_014641 [Rhizopus arrhizus]|uniref:FAD:protein FMN transferase n=1 Tax=Rhizopus oryzae TaxID=64495 RepID=A0A9P7BJB1_RHIOR|nr:hypothetical protein G6F23_015587 [Rhizopus arrhizus]KAG1278474.1 hypothetical protein G6F64_014641 [Rhizopus arrhizus]